jgi:uncharacterized protein (TIGR01777 family)
MHMATFTFRSPMPASAEALYEWHARPGAFRRLQPPWERVQIAGTEGEFGTDGQRLEFQTQLLGPIKGTWVAEMYDFRPGMQFRDRQLKGPFASWDHTHSFLRDGPDRSFLDERIEYRAPGGLLGRLLTQRMVRKRLEAMFRYRHALTASDLRRHAKRPAPLKVVVTGSRGLVGSDLVPFLLGGGHSVTRLVSGEFDAPKDGTTWVRWHPKGALDLDVIAGHDAVIHLAGDGIADGRWNAAKKARFVESRTIPTRHLADAIAALPDHQRPKVFASASAVGVYGDRGDDVLPEDAPAGTGFLADVCTAWEAAADPARRAGVRVVHPRIGVVLTPKGGALGKQLLPFKMCTGAVLGSGKQWLPWITLNDLVGVLHECVVNESLSGPVNACAPNPVTNRAFTKTLGRVLRRPAFFWLPRPVMRVMFGEVADAVLLASLRVLPSKLTAAGFAFDHPELEPALRFVLGR